MGLAGVPWAAIHVGGETVGRGGESVGAVGLSSAVASTALIAGDGNSLPVYETGWVVATVPVGSGPYGVGYDGGNGDVYVANSGSSTVSVISGTSNAVVATVGVGAFPFGVAYDGGNGDVYVANYFSNTASVISGTSNKVVATVPVGSEPVGVGYDGGNGDVYVANSGSSTVSVISGTSNAVVATVSVGSTPEAVGYDGGNGGVYVANVGSNNVSVISGTRNAVVATVPVGSEPFSVTYDGGNGDVYVANVGSNNVSVISGTSNTVAATVSVESTPEAVSYDGGNGDVYVANEGSNNVSVISGTSNAVVATVSVESAPEGVGYDGGNGDVYVANWGSNNVSVISTMLDLGALSAAPTPTLDVGQTRELSAPVVGRGSGIAELTSAVSPSAGLSCSPTAPNNVSVNATCAASTAGSYTVRLTATDTMGNSVWTSAEVTAYSDPTVSVPLPTRASADVGQTVVFSSTATGGPGTYRYYSWSAPSALGCAASTSNTLVCVPTGTVTSATVSVNVTDTNLETSATGSTTYTSSADPSVSVPWASPSVVDVGQTTTLSVVATNGTKQASIYSWLGLPPGCSSVDSARISCAPADAGTYSISVTMEDSNGVNVTSGALALVVTPTSGPNVLELTALGLAVAAAVIALGSMWMASRGRKGKGGIAQPARSTRTGGPSGSYSEGHPAGEQPKSGS